MKKALLNFGNLGGSIDELHHRDLLGKIIWVNPDEIFVRSQPRKAFHEVENLASMILKEGQHDACKLLPKDDNGKYELLHGETRLRAVSLLRSKGHEILLKCELTARPECESERVALQTSNNIHRNDLNPVEIGMALSEYRRLKEAETGSKITNIMIAERFGKDESYVCKYIGMSEVADCIASLVHQRLTSDIEMLGDLKQWFKYDPQACAQFCNEVLAGDHSRFTRKFTRSMVASVKGRIPSPMPTAIPLQQKPPQLTAETDPHRPAKPLDHQPLTDAKNQLTRQSKPVSISAEPAPQEVQELKPIEASSTPKLIVQFHLDDGKTCEGELLLERTDQASMVRIRYKVRGTVGTVTGSFPLREMKLLRMD